MVPGALANCELRQKENMHLGEKTKILASKWETLNSLTQKVHLLSYLGAILLPKG